MADDVWILGIHMTDFGKHRDKDTLDLGAEAVLGALRDAGAEMRDIGVLAAGNLIGNPGYGQMLQKQIGQTGIPVYNVSNACATGATALRVAIMAVKAGETDMGLAVGVEKLSGAGLLTGSAAKKEGATWQREGRFGAVADLDGRIGTETMPGVFAQIGMEYDHRYGGADFALFGPVWESPGKKAQGMTALVAAIRAAPLPVFAVGGVTPQRAKRAITAGAHGVACIRAVLGSPNPAAAALDMWKAITG